MPKLLTETAVVVFQPDPPWVWVGFDGKVSATVCTPRAHASGRGFVTEVDVVQAGLQLTGMQYNVPGAFDVPGSVVSVTMTVVPTTLSRNTTLMGLAMATSDTSGTFVASCAPAVDAKFGVPDPKAAMCTGRWSIEEAGQDVATSN